MDADGKLGKLAKELHRHGITREQLVAEISGTYRKASHPPTAEEAFDLARSFVDWLPRYEEEPGEGLVTAVERVEEEGNMLAAAVCRVARARASPRAPVRGHRLCL